jgi:hypothetical protein
MRKAERTDDNITSRELDGMARRGFEALRKVIEGEETTPTDDAAAAATLKMLGHGSQRYGAETNRAAVMYKVIKDTGAETGMGFDALRPILNVLVGTQEAPARNAPKTIDTAPEVDPVT